MSRARLSVLVGAALVVAMLAPASSFAAVSCQYNIGSKHLEVFESSPAKIVRSGSNINVMNGANVVACNPGGATVNNTDAIIVFDSAPPNFAYFVTIDLTGGAFAPGADNEPGSNDEIEIELQDVENVEFEGTSGVDHWRFGTDGANLNGASEANILTPGIDTDVTFLTATDRVRIDGGGSSDIIRGNGGLGAGSAFQIPMELYGVGGDDQLTGGDANDKVGYGAVEDGNDNLSGGSGDDELYADHGNDVVSGGAGTDLATYFKVNGSVTVDLAATGQQNTGGGGLDTISGVENVFGSPFADTLSGDGAANQLEGFSASDTLDGRGGVDTLLGDGMSSPFGNDVLLIRDGGPDNASCGPEADTVTADLAGIDTIAADCESIDFAAFVPSPDGGGGGGDGDGGGSGSKVDVTLSARKRQDVLERRGLIVRAGCPDEDCEAIARGQIRITSGSGRSAHAGVRPVRLRPVSESLAAGVAEKLRLALPKKGAKRTRAALDQRSPLPAVVRATVTDADDNRDTAKARIKVVD